MRSKADKELTEYRKLIGDTEYKRQYQEIYYRTKTNMRYSGSTYTNTQEHLDYLKEKYKNGVPDEVMNDLSYKLFKL